MSSATHLVKLRQLERRVGKLEAEIQSLKSAELSLVWITNLDPEPFDVLEPIEATVQRLDEDEYLATFAVANINASGDTHSDALAALREMIVAKFNLFEKLGEEKLGPDPTRQLAILKTHLRRSPNAKKSNHRGPPTIE